MAFVKNPDFERNFREAVKSRNVSLLELMPPQFMQKNTKFQDIQEMFDKGPLSNVKQEELAELLKSDQWSEFVRMNTQFTNWDEMLNTAGLENMKQHLQNQFES